jgi:hypothetical protein
MQVKLILVCALLGLLLCLPSCSTAPSSGGINLELSCDDFMNLKHVKVCKALNVAVVLTVSPKIGPDGMRVLWDD